MSILFYHEMYVASQLFLFYLQMRVGRNQKKKKKKGEMSKKISR